MSLPGPSASGPSASGPTASSAGGPGLDPVPGEWTRVSPKYVWVDLAETGLRVLIGAAIVSTPWILGQVAWLWVLPAAAIIGGLVFLAFIPRRVRAIGYRLRADDLVLTRGILIRRVVAVPYGRMQLVDVTQGPVDRPLGLAKLKLVTAAASSAVELPGLVFADAEALRDSLVALAETRRAGL